MLSARCLLLGTVRARNSRIAVLRRQDRGDLFISSGSRSVRCHRRWLPYGRLHTRGGTNAVSVARSPIVRLIIRLLFAVPAARAGYDVTLAVAYFGIPQEWWRESFAMLGAIAVGCTAWARVSLLTELALRPDVAFVPAQPPIGATTKGR